MSGGEEEAGVLFGGQYAGFTIDGVVATCNIPAYLLTGAFGAFGSSPRPYTRISRADGWDREGPRYGKEREAGTLRASRPTSLSGWLTSSGGLSRYFCTSVLDIREKKNNRAHGGRLRLPGRARRSGKLESCRRQLTKIWNNK